jgi:MoaA/NifB/PqqE/SkfB family radical SAM enzyme
MPVCLALKYAAAIGPTGKVRPCCAWDNNSGKESDFNENWKMKHAVWYGQMAAGDWLPECRECKQDEENNGKSLRKYYNEILNYSKGVEYWDFKINNTCNLQCRMCDPTNSSTWDRFLKQHDPNYNSVATGWHRNIDEILPELYTAKVVKFTGGEPFLIPQVKQVIEFLVDEDIAPAVILQFITNGTVDITEYYDLLSFFKHVNITVSVDAIGPRYEYIRSGANWNTTEKNILNIKKNAPANVKVGVTALPMALNINNLHEVESWCTANKITYNRASDLIEPAYLAPGALADVELKQQLIAHMERLDRVHGTNYRDFI